MQCIRIGSAVECTRDDPFLLLPGEVPVSPSLPVDVRWTSSRPELVVSDGGERLSGASDGATTADATTADATTSDVTTAGATLLARIAAGDQAAVAECVAEYGALLWSLARRWSPDASDAEDAVQEVFFDLWKSAARFDPARATERGFVVMVARRRLIDRLRKRARQVEAVSWPDDFDVADSGPHVDERAGLAIDASTLLDGLTPVQRRLLERHLLDGRTHDELAQETSLPLGTVKSHIRRGLLRARALLAGRTPGTEDLP
jgi:RNA polymerase sigma-70 factor (ECF subfamily)